MKLPAATPKVNQLIKKIPFFLLLFYLLSLTAGCARFMAAKFSRPLQTTLEQQADLELLYQGLPSLLLLNETLLADYPEADDLLLNSVRAESSYAELLEVYDQKTRAAQHAAMAVQTACKLLDRSLALTEACTADSEVFTKAVTRAGKEKTGALFWSAAAMATNMRLAGGAPAAAVLLPKARTIMNRLAIVAPSYYHGGPHIFLGTLYGMLPPMLGGNPEKSRTHFEAALKINDRRFLLTQVLYAESYARQTMDRTLFESLLREVLAADIKTPDLQAANALAKKKASLLLQNADQYF